jgi:hypothetical protein
VPSLFRLPTAVRNPVSLLGIGLATTMAVLFVVLFLLEAVGAIENPYIGLLVFVTVPLLFVIGLLLIPIGIGWSARRRRLYPERSEWPTIDLRNPQHRRVTVAVLALTLINVVIVSIAAGGAVHYMDSSQFCGRVCHTTMEPEYVAYQVWPHARVACAECHVGPGAGALVQAKLGRNAPALSRADESGADARAASRAVNQARARYVRALSLAREVPRRQAAHDSRIRERREEHRERDHAAAACGWWKRAGRRRQRDSLAYEPRQPRRVRRGERRYSLRSTHRSQRSGARVRCGGAHACQYSSAPLQRMDCMDCHNRPAHTMFFTPERAIDTAIAQGVMPRDLPFVRREAVAAVSATYGDRQAALDGIAMRLQEFYRSRPGVDTGLVKRAVAGTQDVWANNVFPAMRVKWGTYPNNIGHVDAPGCFRCHDDSHKANDGSVIRQDCELCHSVT